MEARTLPIPLARGLMRLMPPSVLARAVAALVRKMEHRHPRLFRNLARLQPAVVHIEPLDVPHRFALKIGVESPSVEVLGSSESTPPDACIKGRLDALLNLLEGRIDGDRLFFTRDILISGNTSVIVALRNTLDREEINLLDAIASLGGPFARPVSRAVLLAGAVGTRLQERFREGHEAMHQAAEGDLAREGACLREEIEALKTRLAKNELRHKRKEAEAA